MTSSTSPHITISAKDLGELAQEGFCPRCFWLGRHLDLPFEGGFPGIFSSLDSYTKAVVNERIRRGAGLPSWLSHIGKVKTVTEPNYRKFRTTIDGATITGSLDAILHMESGSYVIIDYKTARAPKPDLLDELMSIYQIQLNGYALIAEELGMSPVEKLALVYFEPPDPKDKAAFHATAERHTTGTGFTVPFAPHVEWVDKNLDRVRELLREADRIYQLTQPPAGVEGCEDCVKLRGVVEVVNGGDRSRSGVNDSP